MASFQNKSFILSPEKNVRCSYEVFIYFDLALFSDSLLMLSHSIILGSSLLIKVCVSTLLCLLLNVFMVLGKVLSSAYIIKSNFVVASDKSFIYMINNKGPRIEPCGTPICKGKISDLQSSISVNCFLFLSNFQIVSELNLPVRNSLAYVIKSYDQLYQMPLISQETCQLESYLYPFYL